MLGTATQLAHRVDGTVAGDGDVSVARIASIDEAGADALTFATTAAYAAAAAKSRAGAVLIDRAVFDELSAAQRNGRAWIVVENARLALATLLRAFDRPRKSGPFVHPTAVIDPSATLGSDVYVGAHAVIEADARIGARSVIDALAFVGIGAVVGEDATLYPRAAIMEGCNAGARVILYPGCVIGSEGFGYVFVEGRFERIPQTGNVVLGDDVEIGANTCVDRAQTGSTQIGEGTKIDNLVQIGHNCRIGKHSGMAAQAGLAGSTILGDYALVGGQAGFKGHITIGSRATIGAGSAVWGDVPDGAFVSGRPARPHQETLRQEVMVRNLPKLVARVQALERAIPDDPARTDRD